MIFLERFYTNWVDLLLGFLLVILFVALCISICAYSSRSKSYKHQVHKASHFNRSDSNI